MSKESRLRQPTDLRTENRETKPEHQPKSLRTTLLTGEVVLKTHKVLACSGCVEELIGLLGKIKASYFSFDSTSSKKAFAFARFTEIQEDLFSVIRSITSTVKNHILFDSSKVKELEKLLSSFTTPSFNGIPGNSAYEADVYYAWTVCRRVERQLCNIKDSSIGVVLDDVVVRYINLLGKYLRHMCKREF